jgi:hypothetical protein
MPSTRLPVSSLLFCTTLPLNGDGETRWHGE